MTATVDGASFVACIVQGVNDNGLVSVTGQAYEGTDVRQLQVSFEATGVGVLSIGDAASINQGRYTAGIAQDDTYTSFFTEDGQVEVTALDDASGAGTFRFAATNGSAEIQITGGEFTVDF